MEKVFIYQHKSKQFKFQEMYIYDNVIVVKNVYYELSKCYHEIKLTKTKNCEGLYLIVLFNNQGKEFIIANNEEQMKRIQVLLKRFCINKNYFGKYQLLQRSCLPISQAIKNNSEEHCTQVYEKRLLKDPKEFQIFHNSITIMHTLKTKHSTPKLYEDNYKYYILGEKMKLQSLENLLLNGFDFQEVPFVSIIFMILQNLQKYQQRNIYHGNINLSSIFINVENETLEIVILYPRYLEDSDFTIENDLYNLGILIYQITFYTMSNRINQHVDLDLIDRIHNLMADQNYKENKYPYLYRVSQLDLIRQLLQPNISLCRAIKHQWFVTIQQNIKHQQIHQQLNPIFLPTIVEINDSLINSPHVKEGRIVNFNNQQFLQDQDPEEYQLIKCQIVNTIRMIPSKRKHDEVSQCVVHNSIVKRTSLTEITKSTTVK
ncbi:unnamed protein product (macronuclear) [Paramecium tetraurelia]|uniref:Protein kinase domain-containing protein n=1 Tax=Paramecium tetraurelia TaxID=5888 RepID=A0CSV3_PARTE|nr:uncharacterized protein GSPATT00010142001 [Paramecium tetraurelia]CAK73870.1 unnamed protein product [Paramecium tetraurelia]|eukprot:XP_001441267.1 hypothetical protein (macronuclear) [Paramecium tetraurelia strain d4-2]